MGNDQKKGKGKGKVAPPPIPTANEIKTYIMIIQGKLTLNRNKKLDIIKKKKREIAQCLKDNNLDVAKAKMDSIIRDEDYIICYDILGPLCEILKERVTYILNNSECPPDLRAQLDTVIYAATRLEIEELQKLRDMIYRKYGQAYIMKADSNADKLVNVNLEEKLKIKPANDVLVTIRLKQLCKEMKIPYEFPEDIGGDMSLDPMKVQNPYEPQAGNPYEIPNQPGQNNNSPYNIPPGLNNSQFNNNPYGPPTNNMNNSQFGQNNNNPYGPPPNMNNSQFGQNNNNNPYGPPPNMNNSQFSQNNNNPYGPPPNMNKSQFGQNNNNPYGPPPDMNKSQFGQNNNNNPYGPPPDMNKSQFGQNNNNNPYGPPPSNMNNSQFGQNNNNNPYGPPPNNMNNSQFGQNNNNPYGPPSNNTNNSQFGQNNPYGPPQNNNNDINKSIPPPSNPYGGNQTNNNNNNTSFEDPFNHSQSNNNSIINPFGQPSNVDTSKKVESSVINPYTSSNSQNNIPSQDNNNDFDKPNDPFNPPKDQDKKHYQNLKSGPMKLGDSYNQDNPYMNKVENANDQFNNLSNQVSGSIINHQNDKKPEEDIFKSEVKNFDDVPFQKNDNNKIDDIPFGNNDNKVNDQNNVFQGKNIEESVINPYSQIKNSTQNNNEGDNPYGNTNKNNDVEDNPYGNMNNNNNNPYGNNNNNDVEDNPFGNVNNNPNSNQDQGNKNPQEDEIKFKESILNFKGDQNNNNENNDEDNDFPKSE